jgi:hypothetical protein
MSFSGAVRQQEFDFKDLANLSSRQIRFFVASTVELFGSGEQDAYAKRDVRTTPLSC